mmetsp:Transcript_43094/g.122155  ORF Transcript_43094/g.122155 Transcript_43094/m.122155 type:complete len:248 (+) Transcript_43094:219-962(+)
MSVYGIVSRLEVDGEVVGPRLPLHGLALDLPVLVVPLPHALQLTTTLVDGCREFLHGLFEVVGGDGPQLSGARDGLVAHHPRGRGRWHVALLSEVGLELAGLLMADLGHAIATHFLDVTTGVALHLKREVGDVDVRRQAVVAQGHPEYLLPGLVVGQVHQDAPRHPTQHGLIQRKRPVRRTDHNDPVSCGPEAVPLLHEGGLEAGQRAVGRVVAAIAAAQQRINLVQEDDAGRQLSREREHSLCHFL